MRTLISGNRIKGLEISYQIPEILPQDYFHIITTKEGELYYTANSSQGFKSGQLTIGKPSAVNERICKNVNFC